MERYFILEYDFVTKKFISVENLLNWSIIHEQNQILVKTLDSQSSNFLSCPKNPIVEA